MRDDEYKPQLDPLSYLLALIFILFMAALVAALVYFKPALTSLGQSAGDRVSETLAPKICKDETVASYDDAWVMFFQASSSLQYCRWNTEPEPNRTTSYCDEHSSLEARILAAVPCFRDAAKRDLELGIEDPEKIRRASQQLDEYLVLRRSGE